MISLLSLVSIHSVSEPVLHTGIWRGVISLKEAELPFNFKVQGESNGVQKNYFLEIINGEEKIRVDEISIRGDSIFIRMPVFDSEFRLRFESGKMNGLYVNHARTSDNIFPFHAEYGKEHRFTAASEPVANLSGKWECDFSKNTPDSSKATGVFQQEGNKLTGTFLTPSGDYRFLEGVVSGDEFSLSCFDGSHAFLFTGKILEDKTLSGIFYSGNHWKEAWYATKNENFNLPDPYSITYLKPGYSNIDFSFPDLDGKKVSLSDPEFRSKVIILQITGTWCPNCMDETAFYSPLYDQYRHEGLEILALAFEKYPEFEKAKHNLERLKQRYNIHYTLLFAGKVGTEASKALPMLSGINGYPTSIFIDRQGKVRKIYTGISGPATGTEHEKWKEETIDLIEELLAEK